MSATTAPAHAPRPARAASPFAVRGVVEGFYGPPYTSAERDGLIAWAGARGFNLYLYGPKNDRQHRMRWREPYPAEVLAQFGRTVQIAAASGVDFAYALSPSVSICYSDPDDFALLTAKLGTFYDLGVRRFGLFFDDIVPELRHPDDVATYGSLAHAHAALANHVDAWLKARDPACALAVCPTDYAGPAPFGPYLWELGLRLRLGVDVFYTGPATCAPAISAADSLAFAAALRRQPIIWDNYPVNDLAMRPELHLGPLRGRDPWLYRGARGVVVNPMLQPAASRVALATYADFLADPHAYAPEAAWPRALAAAAGPADVTALLRFAENSVGSALGEPEGARLGALISEALAALHGGEQPSNSPAVAALAGYLADLDEASYHLKNRAGNLALRAELLPWLELCDLWLDVARRALRVLEGLERGVRDKRALAELGELLPEARAHHKRYGARALEPLAELALSRAAPAR